MLFKSFRTKDKNPKNGFKRMEMNIQLLCLEKLQLAPSCECQSTSKTRNE